jgi:O-antigen/teichoic acid export membrane protein
MGVIARQSIKVGIVNYIAIILGMANTFFIYTLCFDESQIGFFRWLQDLALLFSGILSLGMTKVSVRYFPLFKTQKSQGHHGLLSIISLIITLSFTLFVISFLVLKAILPDNFAENYLYIFAIVFAVLWSDAIFVYTTNVGSLTIPSFFRNFWLKFGMGFSALLYFFSELSFDIIILVWLSFYYFGVLGKLGYLKYLGELKFVWDKKFYRKKLIKSMSLYAGYGILGIISSGLATKIDVIMISEFLQFDRTGVYAIAINTVAVMATATLALYSISSPVISQSIKSKNWDNVASVYTKAGINLALFGLFIFSLIWNNVDAIFQIIPNGERYVDGKYVILILGITQLFEMTTSVNESIIQYSKYFRFNLYVLLMLAVMNIFFNVLLIPEFNIYGAAMATGISLVFYNIIKTTFIYVKFKIHPFHKNMIGIYLIGIFLFFSLKFWNLSSPYIDLVVKSLIIGIVFIMCTLFFRLSEDFSRLWNKYTQKIFKT